MNSRIGLLLGVCLFLWSTGAGIALAVQPAGPAPVSLSREWVTQTDFDACYRDRYLDSLSEPGAVKLVHRVLVTDDMGAGYNNYQPIRGKTQARKILLVPDADVRDATLFVDGKVKACDILVNGTVLGATPLPSSFWDANFERYPVPPQLLRVGANEFVFRARGDGQGSLRVERSLLPNRSAVSRDGGFTWDCDRLCDGGYIDGEFTVRLSLGRYAPAAWIESPVQDLAAVVLQEGIPAGTDGRIEALTVDADVPRGTSISAFVRTGDTPDGYAENWGPWQPWAHARTSMRFARFVQWRLFLTTSAAEKTPVVRRVAIRLTALPPTGTTATRVPRIVEDANERIVRSSYEFAYASHTGNSRVLREQWKLDDVIASGKTEFEKQTLLRQWVRNQWNNGWDSGLGALHYVPSWDARVILTLASKNLSLGMCTHYATTLVQCSQALGYPARSIFHGHALTEMWSNDFKKWMIMDSGADPNKRRRATYYFERNGVPLNNLEVRKAYFLDRKWDDITVRATNMSEGADQVEPPFVGTREELETKLRDGDGDFRRQMFMELRNNFIDYREPEEPEHGMGYFKYLGQLYWKDNVSPDIRWTDFFTTREADIYWTLNQAQMYLLKERAAGTLSVLLDTVTPNFAGYEYRIDGGAWAAWTPGSRAGAVRAFPLQATGGSIEFPWVLHPGRNTLEARPFNTAGLRGIISRFVVEQ